ncbi:cysteine desulfurase family protein [Vagococcus sp. JNUCC 83]
MIYFDNSATTMIHPQVLDTYNKVSQRFIGNPSSLHRLGQQSSVLLEKSRQQIAEILGVDATEIFFTSGGTEGNNWVLKGTAIEKRPFGNHVIVSSVEHPSVTNTAKQLQELGFDVSFCPVTKDGLIDVTELEKLVTDNTILISTVAVNSEVGMLQSIEEISLMLKKYPSIHYHVDAVQAITKIPVEKYLTKRVDFVTFSAHKFQGPRGVGFIYWRNGAKLSPLLTGGGQEHNKRSGTENTPAIVAMAKALRLATDEQSRKESAVRHLKESLAKGLQQYEHVTIFSSLDEESSAPHILTFGLKGVRGEVLVHALEEKDIYISTTSACSSKQKTDSSTLHAMGVTHQYAETAVRVSLNHQNTMAEVEQFLIIFNQLYKKFSKIYS